MSKEIEDWVLIEAAKRCDWAYDDIPALRQLYADDLPYAVICDMIQKYEARPVDRKELCARKAMAGWAIELDPSGFPKEAAMRAACVRAINLWEEGFGRD